MHLPRTPWWSGGFFALVGFVALALWGCGDDDPSRSSSNAAPLRILVTNDDGVAADGIDAIVKALASDPRNEVIVCAPSGNRSGTGDGTGPSARCGDLTVTAATTQSGYAATAINGCPADAVTHGLATLYPQGRRPHLVIAGINEGQNVSLPVATRLSGTVGAARTAGRQGIPALAASQGTPDVGVPYDYRAGVDAVLAWLSDHRSALLAGAVSVSDVDNLNVPTCNPGSSIRGTIVDIPLARSSQGALNTQNCASTLQNPTNDVEAFLNGYTTLSRVPLQNG
jgi:5'-nucleotidase